MGQLKSMVADATAAASGVGSSLNAAAASASRSIGLDVGFGGRTGRGGGVASSTAGEAAVFGGRTGAGTVKTLPQWGHFPLLPANSSLTLTTFLQFEQRNLIAMIVGVR
jgi:hypothetical protein